MPHQTDRQLGYYAAPRGSAPEWRFFAGLAGRDRELGRSAFVVGVLLLGAVLPAPAQSSQVREPSMVSEAGTKGCNEDIAAERDALELSPFDRAQELELARLLAACGEYTDSVARYQRILQDQPQSVSVLTELGETLLRAERSDEAIPVFRQALQFIPNGTVAALGLARALAAAGNYDDALRQYGECLQSSPGDYDALQGKAFVLYWTNHFAEAKALFQELQARQLSDRQNAEALENIADHEEESRWAALLPPAGSPPADFLRYYEERLQLEPRHHQAGIGLARTQVELGEYPAAIRTYSRVLTDYPDDRDAKLELARLLAWNHQYADAIKLYREVTAAAPQDVEALEGLGRVLAWSGHLQDAAETYERLIALNPANAAYVLELARLQSRLGELGDARQTFASLLAMDPGNREARLQLARIELRQGDYAEALRHFKQLLKQNPRDFDVRLGEAQVYYYRDQLGRARTLASILHSEQPHNFDVIFLLAGIERAKRNRRAEAAFLDQCERLSPNNAEVAGLRERLRDESPIVLHTTAAFARETSLAGSASEGEDLRNFDFGTTLDFALLPRTDSSLSFSYLPSSSPDGAIQGSVGPGQFMYRQTTRLSHLLTVRAGAGFVRFGPGDPQVLPGNPEPVPTATLQPIGFVGASLFARQDLSFDLNWTRSAITYTPLSVRLGVIAENIEGRLNYLPTPRTELHLTYYQGLYFSEVYEHATNGIFRGEPVSITVDRADHQRGSGGSIVFAENLIRSRHLAWDLGYWGLAFGFNGLRNDVYTMGFFTPSFYQRQLLTTRLQGKLWGPVGYDFSGGIGLQQIEQGQALTRALTLNPAFKLRVSPRLSLRLGYTYYDSAPGLGKVSGNTLLLSTDYKF
jgi:tetratricopeptide (TPR) repeat protein